MAGKTLTVSAFDLLSVNNSFAQIRKELDAQPTASAQVGVFGSIGQVSKNNSSNSTTQFDMDADTVMLRDSSNGVAVRFNPGSALTCNINTPGPAVNGRDQSGAFSASSWVHFYWLWDGTTLATIASATAPPTGPNFPGGYSFWAYSGATRLNASSQLLSVRIIGDTAYYDAQQAALTNGAATTETAVSLAALIPPNASEILFGTQTALTPSAVPGQTYLRLRTVSGSDAWHTTAYENSTNQIITTDHGRMAVVSQSIYYLHNSETSVTSRNSSVWIRGYVLPNGGA